MSIIKKLKTKVETLPRHASLLISYLIIPAWINTAVNLFYFLCNDFDGSRHFGGIFFSYLFACLLNAFLLTVCRREKLSVLLLSLFSFILSYGSQIKLVLSGMNPVFLTDLYFVSDGSTLSVTIKYSDLAGIILSYLPETLLLLFLLILPILAAFFFNYRIPSQKTRLVALAASALVLLLIFLPIKPLHTAGASLFFGQEQTHDPIDYYNEKGFFSGIIAQYWLAHPTVENHSEEIEAILDKAPEKPNGEWGKPNIIMIFSESFFDLGKLEDVTFSQKPTANYTALKDQGISFSMLSPSIGGLSCNSEFQILTSGNMSAYPLGYVPYTMLYDQESHCPSIIEELANNGYSTEIVSTWERNLCNCNTVYSTTPLESFRYNYREEIKGIYPSDRSVGEMIKTALSEKDSDPLFLMTQTAQAHMPYFADKYDEYDIDILSSPLNERENGILRSYAQGIYDADRMLAEVYAYIQTIKEPTLLIFYGDHLPTLSDRRHSFYDSFSYFNTDDKLLNEARRYTTEGLILANFELTDDVDYLGQDLLMPYVASHLEIELSPYYRYLAGIRECLPAVGTFCAYDKNGNLYSLAALPDDMRRLYEERIALQNALFS